jgi:polar amino acid transport system permease protein
MQPLLNDLAVMSQAVLFNIYFAAASIPIGFVLAVFLALGKASPNPLINWLSRVYIYAFRGSPLFIQFFTLRCGSPSASRVSYFIRSSWARWC